MLTGDDFVFIHVPRTGGKSITRLLAARGRETLEGQPSRHTTALEARALLGEEGWSKRLRFAFVRNSWDRLVSLYLFHVQTPAELERSTGQPASRGFLEAHRAFRAMGDFGGFLEWVAAGPRGRTEVERHRISQLGYLTDQAGELLVDRVGHYESLERDAGALARELGVDVRLPWINGHLRPHYGRYYSPAHRDLVGRAFAAEIERFGYEFEESGP